MKGRTIKIHLVEGTPNDIMTVEITVAWTGQVLLGPRTKLAELAKRPEVQRAGVYILVGDDPDYPAKEQVYIGESEDVITRLKQHNKSESKDFWNYTLIVVSKDEHLTKSLVRYLESRLIQIVRDARRATLNNGAWPECPKLPESDKADMDYFLAQIQMLLPVLGFSFIASVPKVSVTQVTPVAIKTNIATVLPKTFALPSESPVFHMSVAGAEATAQEIAGEFVVFQGSTARSVTSKALQRGYVELREQLYQEGKLVKTEKEDFWTFSENVPFKSPSAAASTVAGTSRSGPADWKVFDTGQTYKQLREARFDANFATSSNHLESLEDEIEESEKKEVILDIGCEGGGEKIFGRNINGNWQFWSEGSSMYLDENDDEMWRTWEKSETDDLFSLLDDEWYSFYPVTVHPVFREMLREAYEQKFNSLPENRRIGNSEQWERVFNGVERS